MIRLYLDTKRNPFGYYEYHGYVGNDEVIQGMCDDFEIIRGGLMLYFGVSLQQSMESSIVEVYLDDGDNHFDKITDYKSFPTE